MKHEHQKLLEAVKTIKEFCGSRRCTRDCVFDDGDRCMLCRPDLWQLQRMEMRLNSMEAENDC